MINYPVSLDGDSNLYLVHDSLRLQLSVDYNPGDKSITAEGAQETFNRFPQVGIITLTEQCSEPTLRAVSFFYNGASNFVFSNLQLLPGMQDVVKPKRITNVTLNVMAEHHESLKDALLAIQNFVGVAGVTSPVPLEGTMSARINFLRKLVLQPTAWFSANNLIGIVPLSVVFTDQSTRNPESWLWNFGDGTQISIISGTGVSNGTISHSFYTPDIYTVSLTVENQYGSNEIVIQNYVTARAPAPDPATIEFLPSGNQILNNGVLRTVVSIPVQIQILSNGQNPLDPVTTYIWDLQDDLAHGNVDNTIAQYSIGGYFNVGVEVETQLGAYRITTFANAIDVVERVNLWHFIFDPTAPQLAVTKNLYCYEFGLLSEVYKVASPAVTSVTRQYNFLLGQANQSQQITEFRRNNGFCSLGTTTSGAGGSAMLFWATGASANNLPQFIQFIEFNGFTGIYSSPLINGINNQWPRFWNWLVLPSATQIHFLLGVPGVYPQPPGSPVNMNQDTVFLNNLATVTTVFQSGNLLNGATELQNNIGAGIDGDFSVYRAAWSAPNGYFVKNEGSGAFFSLNGFYQTESVSIGQEIDNIRKLSDMPGSVKLEGQLVSLTSGLFFFNNTGEVLVFDPVVGQWLIGGPGVNSAAFRSLQDQSVPGYDNPANTLIACSDGNNNAYLFFDYSVNSDIVYDAVGQVFRSLPARPMGEQFMAGIY